MGGHRERRRILFSGRVQGVGFRFRTREIAQRYPEVSGFVRNLPDGRVELVVEGPAASLSAMVDDVSAAMSGYIEHVDVCRYTGTEAFSGFEIRY